jgi:hypothetical protein
MTSGHHHTVLVRSTATPTDPHPAKKPEKKLLWPIAEKLVNFQVAPGNLIERPYWTIPE